MHLFCHLNCKKTNLQYCKTLLTVFQYSHMQKEVTNLTSRMPQSIFICGNIAYVNEAV
jgi:uncharacterized radical SAM superfamily protein